MPFSNDWSHLVIVGALGLGCATDDSDDSGGESVCPLIEGQGYTSKEEKDCGLGPKGEPATCHWTVSFDSGAFNWFYSDVIVEGTYSCDGANITGVTPDTSTVEGELDRGTGDLRWDGVMYEPES